MHIAIGSTPVVDASTDRAAWDSVESLDPGRPPLRAPKRGAFFEPGTAQLASRRLSRQDNKENEPASKENSGTAVYSEPTQRWDTPENLEDFGPSKRFSAASVLKFAVDPRDTLPNQEFPAVLGELAPKQASHPQQSPGAYPQATRATRSARSSASSLFNSGTTQMLAGPLGSRRNSLTNSVVMSRTSLADSYCSTHNESYHDLPMDTYANRSTPSLLPTQPLQIRKNRISQPISVHANRSLSSVNDTEDTIAETGDYGPEQHESGEPKRSSRRFSSSASSMLFGSPPNSAGLGSRKSISDLKRSIRVRASFWSSSPANEDPPRSGHHRTASTSTVKTKMNADLISLPVPTEESRGKFRNKLRSSPSLLALTTGLDGSTCAAPADASNRESLEELLAAVSYNQVVPLEMAVGQLGNLQKTAMLGHQHIYEPENAASLGSSAGYILVPFGGYDQLAPSDILAALKLQRALGILRSGFAVLEQSCICRGPLPPSLLGGRSDLEPQDSSQLYALCSFSLFGEALPDFDLRNYDEALDVFWQVARALASAERSIHFEHRDLVWQNIRVSRGQDNQLLASVSGTLYSRAQLPGSARVIFTRLDHPRFYQADGDSVLFATYDAIRRSVISDSKRRSHQPGVAFSSGSAGHGSSAFEPKTNVIWLHYLALKLTSHRSLAECIPSDKKRLLESLANTLSPNRHWFSRSSRDLRSAADLVAWGEKRGYTAAQL